MMVEWDRAQIQSLKNKNGGKSQKWWHFPANKCKANIAPSRFRTQSNNTQPRDIHFLSAVGHNCKSWTTIEPWDRFKNLVIEEALLLYRKKKRINTRENMTKYL